MSSAPAVLPSSLAHVINAAEMAGPSGYADALREFGSLAVVLVPAAGVFDVERDDVRRCIESAAARHLNVEAASGEAVSSTAHILFGLAMGLTFAGLTSEARD